MADTQEELIAQARQALKAMSLMQGKERTYALLLEQSYQQQVTLQTTVAPAQNTQFDLGFWEGFLTGSPPAYAGQTIANRSQGFTGRYATSAAFGTWVKSRPMYLINMYARVNSNTALAATLNIAQSRLSNDGDLIPGNKVRNIDLRQDFQTLPTQWPAEGFVIAGDRWLSLFTTGQTNAAGDSINALMTLVPCDNILSLAGIKPSALKYSS